MGRNIIQIPDYSIQLELLLEQYKNSPKLIGILESLYSLGDDLETALFEIRDMFWIDTAEGVQLDIIGIILSVSRNGLSDEDYRFLLREKTFLIKSGTPEDIIGYIKLLFGASYVNYYPAYPGKYYIYTDVDIFGTDLDRISPAGVQGYNLNDLTDAVGNFLTDAYGNHICAVG